MNGRNEKGERMIKLSTTIMIVSVVTVIMLGVGGFIWHQITYMDRYATKDYVDAKILAMQAMIQADLKLMSAKIDTLDVKIDANGEKIGGLFELRISEMKSLIESKPREKNK